MKRIVIEHAISPSIIASDSQGKTSTGTAVLERTEVEEDFPWLTIVWDDPINLMNYVTYVFQTVLGYSRPKANELMLQVHNEGKAIVSSGSKEKVEIDVRKLQTYGLWATMQQSS